MDTRNPPPRNGERGVALVFVLAVTMVMVILVTDLSLRAGLAFDRSRRALQMAEARSLLRKMESGFLTLNTEQLLKLSSEAREFDVNDFHVRLGVAPEESKININRLDDLAMGEPIQGLFGALLKREHFEQRASATALDWVDADNEPRTSGAERSDYIGEDVTPRNAPFETVDELSFVRGFRDPSSFERIRPLITAYGSGKIYIPAASDEMLDLFQDVYGIVVRNNLEDLRRNPGRELRLPPGMLSPDALKSLQSLLTSVPTTWQITLILTGNNFYSRQLYVLVHDEQEGGQSSLRRIG